MRPLRDSDCGRINQEDVHNIPKTCAEGRESLLVCELPTYFGTATVGLTERGIRSLSVSQTAPRNPLAGLPLTLLTLASPRALEVLQQLAQRLASPSDLSDLPVDLCGTPFQLLVWRHLRTIVRGTTASYAEVAEAIGRPQAVRAVARACACNTIALAIPCHRVVRSDGSSGGYRWGAALKSLILAVESGSTEDNNDKEHK